MKYPWAVVGAKVVCVDAQWGDPAWRFIPNTPSRGDVLTIRCVAYWPDAAGEKTRLQFEEIVNPTHNWTDGTMEGSFGADRFKPLHDASKQVEAMRALMLDATVRGKVSA
jgi:hypothetical protein